MPEPQRHLANGCSSFNVSINTKHQYKGHSMKSSCSPRASRKLTLFLLVWLVAGVAASLATFLVLFGKAKHSQSTVCYERCANRARAFQSELTDGFSTVNMYGGLMTAFPNISNEDFQVYANTTNVLVPSSQGVTYIRHVAGPDRKAAEAELGRNITQYDIAAVAGSPTFVTRDPAPEYMVTWRSSQPAYMRLYAGYDSLSNVRLAEISRLARDSGDLVVTYPFSSLLGTTAVSVFYPVYSAALAKPQNATVDQLRQALLGIIVSTFNATDLFNMASSRFQTKLLAIRVYDISAGPNLSPPPNLMYKNPATPPPDPDFRFSASYQYNLGGRRYRLDCEAGASARSVLFAPIGWAVILIIVFLSIGLLVFVIHKWLQQKKAEVHRIEKLNKECEEARERAECADKAKSAFLATMSHELRTPLTGTLGMLDLLRLTSMTDVQSLYVTTMQTSAESLLGCLNDILDFSKIEAGQLRLEEIDLDISAVIHRVVALFSGKLLEKGLRIEVELPGMEDRKARGDPLRIQQVLSNLLSNAIKFTTHGGIAIRWKRLPCCPEKAPQPNQHGDDKGDVILEMNELRDGVRPKCLDNLLRKRTLRSRTPATSDTLGAERTAAPSPGDSLRTGGVNTPSASCDGSVWYEFRVSDTGVGIPEDAQQNLFKSFVQAHDSTTRMYGGTGLGLVICKKLVEAMGGTISVQSEIDKGTTFICTVCLHRQTSISLSRRPSRSLEVPSPSMHADDLIRLSPISPLELQVTSETTGVPQPGTPRKSFSLPRNENGGANDVPERQAKKGPGLHTGRGSERGVERRPGQDTERSGGVDSYGGSVPLERRDESVAQSNQGLANSDSKRCPEARQNGVGLDQGGETENETRLESGLVTGNPQTEAGSSAPGINGPRQLSGDPQCGSRFERPQLSGTHKETTGSDSLSPVVTPWGASEGSRAGDEQSEGISEEGYSTKSSGVSGSVGWRGSGRSTSSDQQHPLTSHASILVAEDNVVNQMLIKKMLKHHGHDVDIVGNGRLAVEAVKSKAYTLCLMDLQMPVLDGIQATEEIRRLEGPTSQLPIYILSADVLAQNKLQHLAIDGYLTKPIKWENVFAVISQQLESRVPVASGKTMV